MKGMHLNTQTKTEKFNPGLTRYEHLPQVAY